jgi:hypothetical protein
VGALSTTGMSVRQRRELLIQTPGDVVGGFTECARMITAVYMVPVSRQGVYAWHRRRRVTGFPRPVGTGMIRAHPEAALFSIPAVLGWYLMFTRVHAPDCMRVADEYDEKALALYPCDDCGQPAGTRCGGPGRGGKPWVHWERRMKAVTAEGQEGQE